MDQMVLATQQWLNNTYGNDSRYNRVTEDGITGWNTIYGLRRALQIEEGITSTSNNFGNATYNQCPPVKKGEVGNLVYIVQGGLWCKGYSPGGLNGIYGDGTYNAVKQFKSDAGFPNSDGNMDRDFMKALLDMSAFKILGTETQQKNKIRSVQQLLNNEYYTYYQICPCNGLYDRDMNKMLIYALQKEFNIPKSQATGSWGPSTIATCKNKNISVGSSDEIVKLIRYAAICNGYYNLPVSISNVYDSDLDDALEEFSNSLMINKPSNRVNYTVIKSLLSSNGDPDRSAIGCDTATKLTPTQIDTIKQYGYQFVGRYITNTPGGTLNKCLTRTEIENILNAGLKIFYIFQESNNSPDKFNNSKGETQALRAIYAMNSLGAPKDAVIYFAVDCDPTDSQINTYIIPYFRGVIDRFLDENTDFKIGVYGTRNVCLKLKNAFENSIKCFVADASYGFSGNLGFIIPSDWCFDQFAVDLKIGVGSGEVSIDKVAVSGRDNGSYGSLRAPSEGYIPDNQPVIFKPTSLEKKAQGRLYVNMNDSLRVYNQIFSTDEEYRYALPNDNDIMYTLPKYAMYVNLGIVSDEQEDFHIFNGSIHRCCHLIKFLDDSGSIRYGYIPVNNKFYADGIEGIYKVVEVTAQVESDIKAYENQREFTNYIVNDTHNALIPSTRQSIDGASCVVYTLKSTVLMYDSSAIYQKTIPVNTKIALNTCNTGKTHNELISVYRLFNESSNKWEEPLGKGKTAYIEYKLELGCMPNNRVISN